MLVVHLITDKASQEGFLRYLLRVRLNSRSLDEVFVTEF